MDDALLVRGSEPVRYLNRVIDRFALRYRVIVETLLHGFAFEQLRDDVRCTVMSANIVNGENVRMIQRARRLCLLLKSPQSILILRECCRQNLNRYVAIKFRVTRAIHFAHSAFTNLGADFVASEFCAGGESHHLKSLIRTTSLVCVPRESASCLPSREKSNQKMRSDVKLVNCLGRLPSTDCTQRFETPLLLR